MDSITLRDALVFLSSTGAGVLAYWLMNRLPAPIDARLSPANTRLLALVLTFLVACAAWGVEVLFGYQAAPFGWRAWCEALFAVGGGAAGLNQIIHGYLSLPSVSATPKG